MIEKSSLYMSHTSVIFFFLKKHFGKSNHLVSIIGLNNKDNPVTNLK